MVGLEHRHDLVVLGQAGGVDDREPVVEGLAVGGSDVAALDLQAFVTVHQAPSGPCQLLGASRCSASCPWGTPMKPTNSANVGSSRIPAAGVPSPAISCSTRRMAPVAASNVPMGKMTIRYPSSFRRPRLIGGGLPPSAPLNSSG